MYNLINLLLYFIGLGHQILKKKRLSELMIIIFLQNILIDAVLLDAYIQYIHTINCIILT